MPKTLSNAEINHLRRLLGWVECEIGQSPEEIAETVKSIAPAVGEPDDASKQRLVESYEKAASVPKYLRQAVKALKKAMADQQGDVVDAELTTEPDALEAPQAKEPIVQRMIGNE